VEIAVCLDGVFLDVSREIAERLAAFDLSNSQRQGDLSYFRLQVAVLADPAPDA
jgi:hypothetical protein